MYRSVFVVVGAVALALATAVPAPALASPVLPSPPVGVRVTGTAALDATVTWSAPRTSPAPVTGYTVTITPAEQQPDNGVDTLPATARTDRFGDLTPGVAYRFAVRSVGRSGASTPVTVAYTAPRASTPAQAFFALSSSGAVERFPIGGGSGTTVVPSGGSGYAVDDLGDVIVPATDGTSIVLYPASGAASRTVATGLSITGGLQMDVPGDVFFRSGSNIVELPITGAPQRVVGPAATAWTVGPDGTVSTVGPAPHPSSGGYTPHSQVISYPPSGASNTRTVTDVEYPQAMLADAHGNVFVEGAIPGASGAYPWYSLPRGGRDLVDAEPQLGFDAVAVNADHFLLLQGAQWCNATAEQFGQCSPPVDRTVPTLRSTSTVTGAVTSTAITGLTLGAPLTRGTNVGAADAGGNVLVDVPSGPTAGLYRVEASGGAVQRLDAGRFTELRVSPAA